ncbi:hypothetical protein [Neobacillus sp. SAB-20_R2A]|uniref:hypothetical protein n=1 Tax=Neobacillus sp. SAB-20_R2A TaxID=3120519 RepID=UPI003C6E75E1
MFRSGLLFFVIGVFFSYLSLGDNGKMGDEFSLMFRHTEVIKGTVTGVSATNTKKSRDRIYAYRFQFKTNGKSYHGISYGVYNNDEKNVKIMYVQNEPEISKIAGMHTTETGPEGLLVLIFPICGLFVMLDGVRKRMSYNA